METEEEAADWIFRQLRDGVEVLVFGEESGSEYSEGEGEYCEVDIDYLQEEGEGEYGYGEVYEDEK